MNDDSDTVESPAWPVEPTAARVIARRYELIDLLGRGGYGEVWRARDLVSREEVAIKLLDRERIAHPVRVRREIAALRRLRVPGVVRLLDEGMEGAWTFIVMELVPGKAFPGGNVAGTADVLQRTTRLLEVLARVHAQGVVHRDLKPANVLVDDRGRVTLLDFGIALGVGEARISSGFDILGTPAYLAPEQVSGEPLGPRTDLYAVGVMLFEALTGELPFESEVATQAIFFERVFGRPRTLESLRPELPAWLGELVAQLLGRHSHQRPRGANEVLARLRAGGEVAVEAELPWLGRAAELAAVEAALGAGRSVVLRGKHGCGGTRFLRVLGERLRASGRRVHQPKRERGIFGPLRPFLEVDQPNGATLDVVRAQYVAALTRLLAGGDVLLVDDLEAVDGATAGVFQRCAERGGIVALGRGRASLAGAVEVSLGPLHADDLGALFQGPERIFHLVSDGSALLLARTDGMPAAVAAEIDSWCVAGFASWDGAQVTLDRDALERILLSGAARGLRGLGAPRGRTTMAPAEPGAREGLPASLEGVLDAVLLASSPLDPTVLSSVLDLPGWEVEAALEDLTERGLVLRLGEGSVATTLAASWETPGGSRAHRRAGLHRRLALLLPLGDERRLDHFLGAHGDVLPADMVAAFVDELLPVVTALAGSGRTERARVFLEDGVATMRRSCELSDDPGAWRVVTPHLLRTLEAWVPLALTGLVPRPMDRVLHELARLQGEGAWGPELHTVARRLDELIRAAITMLHAPSRALVLADAIEPFADPAIELARHSVRVRSARQVDSATMAATIDSAAAWCDERGGVRAQAALLMWRSTQRYDGGRYVEAAECAEQAAALSPDVLARIAATAEAGAAWLEAFRLEDAMRLGAATREAAAAARQPYFEAFGTSVERQSAYRMGRALPPDRAFIDLVEMLAVPSLVGITAMNEAALAFRCGDRDLCRAISGRARAVWRSAERRHVGNMAAVVEIHAGAPVDPPEVEALLRWAIEGVVPGFGLQALALLRAWWPDGWAPSAAEVERLCRQVPEQHWATWIDVLSVVESLAMMGFARPTTREESEGQT